MAAVINLDEVGAFPTYTPPNEPTVRIGVYLPGIKSTGGFQVVVRIIHKDDRFNPQIPTQNFDLQWQDGHPLDLWSETLTISTIATTSFGREGTYLYRFQLYLTPSGGHRQLLTSWFTDPFARDTDVGLLSAFTIGDQPDAFLGWTDESYKTPELDDLVVYELQVEEFNDTFDGVTQRLDYFKALGVNCLELMPITSVQLDFDWGYGPLHYFAPNARFGGSNGLKKFVNACHAAGIAVILDVVYQHVSPQFAYKLVYENLKSQAIITSPMIGSDGPFGPQADFSLPFTLDYFTSSNRHWLDEYHVDGFRYDEVTDIYQDAPAAYSKLVKDTYQHSLQIPRFQRDTAKYSRIIQCAEALSLARNVLSNTYTCAAWQDDLLNKSESMVQYNYADANFAHILDPIFSGYPSSTTVNDASGNPVDMPVAPFQYLETHDHSQLIVSAGTTGDGLFPPGDRSRFYKLQPYAIALYTCQGIPMLWQGQEFADYYQLPQSGEARIGLRRDTHWEFFYDDFGAPLVRLYRRLGWLRSNTPALKGRESYFYYQQSLQGTQIIAYHRCKTDGTQYAMVLLNFADGAGTINVPFPKKGTWTEMVDGDVRQSPWTVDAGSDGAVVQVGVPSNYGWVFVWNA